MEPTKRGSSMASNPTYKNELSAILANRKLNSLYRNFTGGANNSIAETLGAPVDLANRYMWNAQSPVMGADWIKKRMGLMGIGTQGSGASGIAGGILGGVAMPGAGLLNAIDTSAQIAKAQTPGQMLMATGSGLLGEGISALRKPKVMQEMTAYHGSPHDLPPVEGHPIGKFDMSKIGTGEGAQAYGHGLYFAENPNVAKS